MRKLLKYDLKAVFRLWWIFSAAALAAGPLGGLCLRLLLREDALRPQPLEEMFQAVAGLGVVAFVLLLGAYGLGTFVLVIWRYYSHFFTDEGYLTFTLPVSRTALLGSKLLTALIFQAASAAVTLISGFLFVTVGVFSTDYLAFLSDAFRFLFHIPALEAEGVLLIVQGGLLAAATTVLQMLFPFLCATLGAVIAQKHKLLTGISLYFGGRMAVSFLEEFGVVFTGFYIETFEFSIHTVLVAEFIALLVVSGRAAGCWFWNLHLLKKKLNLS